jgi:hypothetical protein
MFCHFKLSFHSAERLNSYTNHQTPINLLPNGFILAFLLHRSSVSLWRHVQLPVFCPLNCSYFGHCSYCFVVPIVSTVTAFA